MTVTLTQLRAFIAVVQHNSFTLAADAVHRTQPAVTVQVRQLESSLGLKLLDRSTRQLRLTTVGLQLAPALARLVHQLDSVIDSTQDLRRMRVGVIRMGCLPSVASTYLPERIASFRSQHPGISFSVSEDLGERILALVKAGEVDFGITDLHTAPEIESIPLWQEQMCAVFLAGHPIEESVRVDVGELARHDLILMAQGSNARRMVDSAFAATGRLAVSFCEVAHIRTAVSMARAGLGIALLPSSGVSQQPDGELRSRALHGSQFVRNVAIIRLRQKTIPPASEAFVQSILDANRGSQSAKRMGKQAARRTTT